MKILTITFVILLISSTSHAQQGTHGELITDTHEPDISTSTAHEYTTPQAGDCTWENIRALDEINTSGADAYPWLSPDGLRLYFTQEINSPSPLVMASRASVDAPFENLETVQLMINASDLYSCWLTSDELELFFTTCDFSSGYNCSLYYAQRISPNDLFSTPVPVQLEGIQLDFFSAPSFTQDKSELFLYSSILGGNRETYVFNRQDELQYGFSHVLPFGAQSGPGQLTKEDLGYYISGDDYNLYSSDRNAADDGFEEFTYLNSINSSEAQVQPSVSKNQEFMVFVLSEEVSWGSNDLYIAERQCPTTNLEPIGHEYDIAIYPVPTSGQLNIQSDETKIKQINIHNTLGQQMLIQSKPYPYHQTNIDVRKLAKGVYFCKIIFVAGHSITKKIIIQ